MAEGEEWTEVGAVVPEGDVLWVARADDEPAADAEVDAPAGGEVVRDTVADDVGADGGEDTGRAVPLHPGTAVSVVDTTAAARTARSPARTLTASLPPVPEGAREARGAEGPKGREPGQRRQSRSIQYRRVRPSEVSRTSSSTPPRPSIVRADATLSS